MYSVKPPNKTEKTSDKALRFLLFQNIPVEKTALTIKGRMKSRAILLTLHDDRARASESGNQNLCGK